ncbi:Aspartate--tRNA ligase [Providencia rettgeri]|uniref:Aspartate--tRNA ligase n=1 Tax=Providencia rettgeri TaxID=587 RepID=A0A379FS89_PRORE|nr:Aspartate--tRNA ligase [Providencia rettgeri]
MKVFKAQSQKFLNEDVINQLLDRTGAVDGDILLFGAGAKNVVTDSMGALRLKVGRDFELTDLNSWQPLWVIDFPMFER